MRSKALARKFNQGEYAPFINQRILQLAYRENNLEMLWLESIGVNIFLNTITKPFYHCTILIDVNHP